MEIHYWSRATALYYPHTAFIVLTTQCHRRDVCRHCFYNVAPDLCVDGAPGTDRVASLLGRLRHSGVRSVIFTGGEPALRNDLPALVAAAKDMSLSVLLLTSGVLITPELADALARAGLDAAVMSLAALDHAENRAADLLSGHGMPRLSLIYCFSKATYERIPEAVQFAAGRRLPLIFQPAYVPRSSPLFDELSMAAVDRFEWSRVYTMLRPWARERGCDSYLKLMYELYTNPAASPRPARCAMSGNAFVVDADGAAYPCFHRRDLSCGNMFPDSDFSLTMKNLRDLVPQTRPAPCFGEHCLSLHTDVV